MPHKDPEKLKEYQKLYQRKLRKNNTDEEKKWKSEYQKEYQKSYTRDQTKRIKYDTIYNWKCRDVIFCDYDLLYDIYINTTHCNLCNVELTQDKIRTKTTRCLDHDHSITDCENVRNILCHSCNIRVQ